MAKLFGLFKKKCSICHRKTGMLRPYRNVGGKSVLVCPACSEYAERRAYKRA